MILATDQLAAEADDDFLGGDADLVLADDVDTIYAELDRAGALPPEIVLR
jgi:hypothetical protein